MSRKPLFIGLGMGSTLIIFLLAFSGHSKHASSHPLVKRLLASNDVSADTSVETLRTLTVKVNELSANNQKIVKANATLQQQVKAALKKQAQAAEHAKTKTQSKIPVPPPSPRAAHAPGVPGLSNNGLNAGSLNATTSPHYTRVPSVRERLGLPAKNNNTTETATDKKTMNIKQSKPKKNKPTAIPVYTIPAAATLTGATLMQPLIARTPINGKVPNPYPFKVIIGRKNLAANGIDMPPSISGMIAQGYSEGDMLRQCARGYITLVTFIFQDGRISTTRVKGNDKLGTLSMANGNPCLPGKFYTNAPKYLGGSVLLGGITGFGNAYSESQVDTDDDGNSSLSNAYAYGMGQALSGGSEQAEKWWSDRQKNSFDYVYVPNIDPNTGKAMLVTLNIDNAIAIDYNPVGRKLYYASHATHLLPKPSSSLDVD